MDLALYLRVVWRFRYLVLVGFLVAVALAGLAVFRVSFVGGKPKLAYRQAKVFEADTLLLVTQKGFPWGRTVLPGPPATGTPTQQQSASSVPYADPTRLAGLAVFYAQLANSDAVQARVDKGFTPTQRLTETMQAAASLPDPSVYNGVLPFIAIKGIAESPRDAVVLSLRGASIFQSYIAQQQAAAGIDPNDRVLLQVIKRPDKVLLVVPRKKTLPIAVFLTVMIVTIGAAFVLENLRPRLRVAEETDASVAPARQIA